MSLKSRGLVLCLTRSGLENILARLSNQAIDELITAGVIPADALRGGYDRSNGRHAANGNGRDAGRAAVAAPAMQSHAVAASDGPQARAATRSIARIARGSRHAACRRDPESGRRYCIFNGRLGDRPFQLLVQPIGERYQIVSVRASNGGYDSPNGNSQQREML